MADVSHHRYIFLSPVLGSLGREREERHTDWRGQAQRHLWSTGQCTAHRWVKSSVLAHFATQQIMAESVYRAGKPEPMLCKGNLQV